MVSILWLPLTRESIPTSVMAHVYGFVMHPDDMCHFFLLTMEEN